MTEKPSDSTQDKEITKWPIPFNVSVEKLDMMVKAFFQAKADAKPVSKEEISRLTGLYKTSVKPNADFLEALNIIKADQGGYSLEGKGLEYAKALSSNDLANAGKLLKELLLESPLKELMDFVELKKSSSQLEYEGLFNQIKAIGRVKENPNHPRGVSAPYSTGIKTLIRLLVRVGVAPEEILNAETVTKKPKKPKAAKKATVMKPETTVIKQERAQVPAPKARIEQTFQGKTASVPITLNITVEAKDPESIRELINLLKELGLKSSTK